MAAEADGTTPRGRIQRLRERIQFEAGQLSAGEVGREEPGEDWDGNLSGADAEALLEFSDALDLQSSTYSDHRHEKLLRHGTIMAEKVGGLADALEDRDAAEDVVRWINRTYDNEETNRDFRVALRVFGKQLEPENGDPPESLEWVPSSTSSTYDPSPEPSDMLNWEDDVLPMIDAARNSRDAAAIALAFDAGPRGGEFEAIRVGDFTDGDTGLKVTLRGKQGKRTVRLSPSVEYVLEWRTNHPATDDAEAPFWCKLDEPERLSYRMITNMLRRPADRAGVDKPVTLTNFRKSSAAYLASSGLNQPVIEDHHGWVRGSKVASRYVSVFETDRERAVAGAWGEEIPEEDEDDGIAPVECPRCGRNTPREKPLCVWCGQARDQEAGRVADAVDDALVDLIAQAEGDDAAELVEIRDEVQGDADLKADVVERIASHVDLD